MDHNHRAEQLNFTKCDQHDHLPVFEKRWSLDRKTRVSSVLEAVATTKGLGPRKIKRRKGRVGYLRGNR
jgi:hypothetical protein